MHKQTPIMTPHCVALYELFPPCKIPNPAALSRQHNFAVCLLTTTHNRINTYHEAPTQSHAPLQMLAHIDSNIDGRMAVFRTNYPQHNGGLIPTRYPTVRNALDLRLALTFPRTAAMIATLPLVDYKVNQELAHGEGRSLLDVIEYDPPQEPPPGIGPEDPLLSDNPDHPHLAELITTTTKFIVATFGDTFPPDTPITFSDMNSDDSDLVHIIVETGDVLHSLRIMQEKLTSATNEISVEAYAAGDSRSSYFLRARLKALDNMALPTDPLELRRTLQRSMRVSMIAAMDTANSPADTAAMNAIMATEIQSLSITNKKGNGREISIRVHLTSPVDTVHKVLLRHPLTILLPTADGLAPTGIDHAQERTATMEVRLPSYLSDTHNPIHILPLYYHHRQTWHLYVRSRMHWNATRASNHPTRHTHIAVSLHTHARQPLPHLHIHLQMWRPFRPPGRKPGDPAGKPAFYEANPDGMALAVSVDLMMKSHPSLANIHMPSGSSRDSTLVGWQDVAVKVKTVLQEDGIIAPTTELHLDTVQPVPLTDIPFKARKPNVNFAIATLSKVDNVLDRIPVLANHRDGPSKPPFSFRIGTDKPIARVGIHILPVHDDQDAFHIIGGWSTRHGGVATQNPKWADALKHDISTSGAAVQMPGGFTAPPTGTKIARLNRPAAPPHRVNRNSRKFRHAKRNVAAAQPAQPAPLAAPPADADQDTTMHGYDPTPHLLPTNLTFNAHYHRTRGGATSQLPVQLGIPTTQCSPVYIETQSGQLCMMHALHNMMQKQILTHSYMHNTLVHHNRHPNPAGNYHVEELEKVVQSLCPTLRLHEGNPHLGSTTGATFAQTLAMQTHPDIRTCDAAILTLRGDHHPGTPHTITHHVAAVRMNLRGNAAMVPPRLMPLPPCVPFTY